MSKYLIKLTTHDKFFFGGENTFGEDNVNYFVKSNYFPQQTSLLGLVRYQLLLQSNNGIFENNKIQKPNEAEKLIGKKSFNIDDNEFSFGSITKLSPVFIAGKENDYLFPANKEYQWVDKEDGNIVKDFVFRQFETKNEGKSIIYSQKEFIPYLKDYKAKNGLPDLLVNKDLSIKKYYNFDNDKKDKPSNGIFIEDKQVGIRKNYEGKSEDNAYYVQTFYKLKDGYSFAFILELEDDTNFSSRNIVTLGGEQSKFKMEVTPDFKENFDDLVPDYEKSDKSDKIVLISDAYVSNDVLEICDFAISETIDFRSIKSSIKETENYAALSKTNSKALDKTDKYNFFKKGSVFYGNVEKIKNQLDKNDNLKLIGYNYCKIIEKNQQ